MEGKVNEDLKFTKTQLADLEKSGISVDDAIKAGAYCIWDESEAKKILNSKKGAVPCLVIPYFKKGDRSTDPIYSRIKPDEPQINKKTGKKVKYLQPSLTPTRIYIPPNIDHEKLYYSNEDLLIVEGEKKAIKACAEGYLCIGGSGVWNFHDTDKSNAERKQYAPKDDLVEIPLAGRNIYICFDRLKFEKIGVLHAEIVLAEMLCTSGAIVWLVHLIDGEEYKGEEDIGVDDYLQQNGRKSLDEKVIPQSWKYPFSNSIDDIFSSSCKDKSVCGGRLAKYCAVLSNEIEKSQISKKTRKVLSIDKVDFDKIVNRFKKSYSNTFSRESKNNTGKNKIDWSPERPFETKYNDLFQYLKDQKIVYQLGNISTFFHNNKAYPMPGIDQFRGLIANYIEFVVNYSGSGTGESRKKHVLPSSAEISTFTNNPSIMERFDKVDIVVDTPVYDNNFNLASPGYNKNSKIYSLSNRIKSAKNTEHLDKLQKDICFADDGSATNRIGFLLASLFPLLFTGKKPIEIWEGNQQSIGKSWAVQTDCIIRNGDSSPTITYTPDDGELEKNFAATILGGSNDIVIDNAKTSKRHPVISSPVLERSITDRILSYRILGQSKKVERLNTVSYILTANDLKLSNDLITRSIMVKLHYEGDPAKRKFGIQNPLEYARKHRKQILAELIGMVGRWIAEGQPLAMIEYRFPEFAQIIGGILEVNGYRGFLENVKQSSQEMSSEYADLEALFSKNPALQGKPSVFASHAKEESLFVEELNSTSKSVLGRKMKNILSRYVGRDFQLEDGSKAVLTKTYNSNTKNNEFAVKRYQQEDKPQIQPQGNQEKQQGKMGICGSTGINTTKENNNIKIKNNKKNIANSGDDGPGNITATTANSSDALANNGDKADAHCGNNYNSSLKINRKVFSKEELDAI